MNKDNDKYIMKIKSDEQNDKIYSIKMSFLNKYPIEESIRRLVISYQQNKRN